MEQEKTKIEETVTIEEEKEASELAGFKAFWNGFSHPILPDLSKDYDEDHAFATDAGRIAKGILIFSLLGLASAGLDWGEQYDKGLVAVCRPDGTWVSKTFVVKPSAWEFFPKKKK